MKKKIISFICLVLMLSTLCGCGVAWNYKTAILNSNNKYWNPIVIVDDGCTQIIKNDITGEYFILCAGAYGVTLTPIETVEQD